MTTALTFRVEKGGDRLDTFLAQQHSKLSRSRWQQLIQQGHVRLNGQVCARKNQPLSGGDVLEVVLPEPEPLALVPEPLPLSILYEDEELLILDKPVDLVVHPAPGHSHGTLVHGLLAHCPDLTGIGGVQRPGIVHRLDKDTSGVMVVAKTEFALQHLQQQLKTRQMQRHYLGVVYGQPPQEMGTVNTPIGRHPMDRKKMAVVPPEKGRLAITHWYVKERFRHCALVEFRLETGRTHQIRVHAAHLGWPLLGDPLYGRGSPLKVKLPGQALHAYRLQLRHPRTGKEVVAIAPLPKHLEKLLRTLRQNTAP
ncbi:MAG: RluA family pseudouridine synthase [Thermosynechococcus sp. Uc]|uniref:RluA family pseudouridine synthase n=1 Tax=Thermosynechococcus sp. Uc TaxID=3034853 RepID=UPI0019DF8765|nr:RluA family pseudouridine synthase [Thermosynechococcus sp. Uc]MDM7327461.1 RluA family pseudouridine synthase [Thermosynechococcus sp. Uc]HIK25888.1 RluA family pseudouridine synthase [Thermosynechococcus sp. M46_R2017_013]